MSRLRELVQDVRMILQPAAGPSSKFLAYFQLLDAFKETGCPVCTRLEQGALKALDGLMYEQVNDPFTRDRLVESHGFCNWHAWMLPGIGNSALGVALIYRHLLEETLNHLQAASQAVRPRGRWQHLWERVTGSREEPPPILAWRSKKARCYLCTFARRSEHDDLKTILDFLGEAEFAEAFTRSAGLCVPHVYQAVAIGRDHPNLRVLLAMHEKRWQDLLWELKEFSRKFDYRYANEARGRESSSWHRVLDVFVGRAAVFGPERWVEGMEHVMGAQGATPTDTGQQAKIMREEDVGELERVRFENEKLRRRVQELLAREKEDHRTQLALEFQILKLTADLKALATELDAVRHRDPTSGDASAREIGSDDQPAPQGGERSQTS